MKTVFRILLVLILVGTFAWTIYYLYQKSEKPPEAYQTTQALVATIIKKTVATGSVVPRKEIEIKPQVSGIVEKIYVEAGAEIKAGDLIAKVKIVPNMVNLNNAENRVNRAKISLQNATVEFERNSKLFNEGIIAETTYLPFKLSRDNAQEELSAAENNLELVREGALRNSNQSSNTLIRSTISGMVLDVPIEQGNSVIESNNFNDGTTIAVVADMNEMIFEGNVDESEVGKIKPGMDLMLTIGAIEDETFDAKLEYIAPKGVEENGAIQFEIRAALTLREDLFVRAGYSATAAIVLDRRDSVLAITESLLQFENNEPFVEVETTTQQFERKIVKLGLSDGINVEILSGVGKEDKLKQWNLPPVPVGAQ